MFWDISSKREERKNTWLGIGLNIHFELKEREIIEEDEIVIRDLRKLEKK